GLERIDLCLIDRNNRYLYVEIEWSSVDKEQAQKYLDILRYESSDFRLMFLIPDDIRAVMPPGVDVRPYSRNQIANIVKIRRNAKEVLNEVLNVLSRPFTPPSSIMYGESFEFPNVISACYFDALLNTGKQTKKIGLAKTSIGRYLDMIRCICQSTVAHELPELTLFLIEELLNAPYYYEKREGQGLVDPKGFYNHVFSRRTKTVYKQIAEVVVQIKNRVSSFINEYYHECRSFYGERPSHLDLLYRKLLEVPSNIFELGENLSVKGLLNYLIQLFSFSPTRPFGSFKHSIANVNVTNNIKVDGFENDFARRIIELGVLKGVLFPVSGVPVIRVLKRTVIDGKTSYERIGCQLLRINRDEKFIRNFIGVV
ncbi:MAG: hypothetical protein QXS68_08585, partial [Candidatus Methanomethylicaceae archaeon]